MAMQLKVLLPPHILVDESVTKVIAEAQSGFFCLLPRHVDMVTALVPGLLTFVTDSGELGLFGIDEGILVKCGPEVLVSTLNAVQGDDLGTLRETVQRRFVELDEHERITRSALARLEAGVVRRFLQLGERHR